MTGEFSSSSELKILHYKSEKIDNYNYKLDPFKSSAR